MSTVSQVLQTIAGPHQADPVVIVPAFLARHTVQRPARSLFPDFLYEARPITSLPRAKGRPVTVTSMSADRDLIARLERIEAELALHRLAHHYCVAADHRDLELWRAVWTPDAVWETGTDPDYVFSGIDAICAAVQGQWQAFPVMQHGTVNHVVDLRGMAEGIAAGRSDVIVHVQCDDNTWLNGGGTYLGQYRHHDGRWRIARRIVARPFDLGPLPDGSLP